MSLLRALKRKVNAARENGVTMLELTLPHDAFMALSAEVSALYNAKPAVGNVTILTANGPTIVHDAGWKPGDGAVPAFWPGYLYDKPTPQVELVKAPVKCDCGSEAAGLGDVHSDWCAKGRGP